MAFQVSAHGFELSEALRENCMSEVGDKLQPLAVNNFSAKWMLSLEAHDQIAHLIWQDGSFRGDAVGRSEDMYTSIHQAVKKAAEQIKKAHEKRHDNRVRDAKRQNLETSSDLEE